MGHERDRECRRDRQRPEEERDMHWDRQRWTKGDMDNGEIRGRGREKERERKCRRNSPLTQSPQ